MRLNVAPKAVGRPLPRREDRRLLTGAADFVGDLPMTDSLDVAFVRSPVAHARIAALDLSAATSAHGVVAVVRFADLDIGPLLPPMETPGAVSTPRPVLADSVVRFAGEPVAAVVASSSYAAEDAAELVELRLDPLPAVSRLEAALADNATVDGYESNVLYDGWTEAGDVDAAFASAAAVVERTFVNPRCAAVPIEPRGALAVSEGEGVRLWSSTQAPHKLAQVVAELLALPRDAVAVVAPDVGGGFGQKAHAYPEEILVAWLARRLGRAVRWLEDRRENLIASSHARDQVVRVRAAADRDGTLLAMDADVVCDTGAYGVYPHGHVLEALGTPGMLPGPYRLRNFRARGRSVATNKCPEGAYRGVGLPVAAFVHERLMDLLAGELGMDPAEIRRRNLLTSDELPYATVTGLRYDSGDYLSALERALEAIGYEELRADRRRGRAEGQLTGVGLACYVESTGINSRAFTGRGMVGIAGYDGAHVTLDDEGTATVWTTLPPIGQGLETTFSQMAADDLGLDVDAVRIARSDTSVGGLHGTGAFASRSAISGGGAIREACVELVHRLREDAGEQLEADPGDIELAGGEARVIGSPDSGIPVGAIVAAADDPERYRISATFDPQAVAFPYATHACQVQVDADTGEVRINRYVVVEDCGRIINPSIVDGQVHGAVAQGLGGTLLEAVSYDDDGQPLTASLMDYLVPTAAELPVLEVEHREIPAPDSPNGAKGVGEGGTLGPPAAIANAVSDALGVEMNELPLSPERVAAAARRALEGA